MVVLLSSMFLKADPLNASFVGGDGSMLEGIFLTQKAVLASTE